MSRLDDALRNALRRQDPGPEFTARVLARAAEQPARRSWWAALTTGGLRWAAAGALACVLVVGGALEQMHERRVEAEGKVAKQQLMLAMRIAGGKLNLARERVLQINEVPN